MSKKLDLTGERFGVDGHLEVMGWSGSRMANGVELLSVYCHTCAKDTELFGNGLFKTSLANLKSGCIPCGCSKRPSWTKEQYTIRVSRKCKDLGFIFNGFVGRWAGIDTKVSIKDVDGEIRETSSIDRLISNKMGNGKSGGITKPDEVMSASFMSSGTFHEGTKFWRVPSSRKEQTWAMSCPICSSDKYVVAGLCSGVFTSVAGSLQQGLFPCRCSTQFRWTQQQREFQITSALLEEGNTAEFIGWKEPYVGCESRAIIYCKEHGNWDASISSLINTGSRCPRCAKTGFDSTKPAWLYVLKISGGGNSFTGYGISNFIDKRLAAHRCTLTAGGYSIENCILFDAAGIVVRDTENAIKAKFARFPQSLEGFKTEATYEHLFSDVANFASSQINIDEPKAVWYY